MKALIKNGKGIAGVSLQEIAKPIPAEDEVLIKIRAVGICGTDLHIIKDEYDHTEPVVLGHEFSGEIAEVGGKVTDWKAGDRVVGELHTESCRTCALCRNGNAQICAMKRPYGTWKNGCLADYFVLPAWLLHTIPDGITFHHAAMIEPAACVMHAILRAGGIKPTETVLVSGSGPTGFLAAQIARNCFGAEHCFVLGSVRKNRMRVEMIAKSGAAEVIVDGEDDPKAIIEKHTGAAGVDIAIETSGNERAIQTALTLIKRNGRCIAFGFGEKREVLVPWNRIVKEDITVVGSFSSGYEAWEEVIRAVERGKLDFTTVLSHKIPLAAWETAFQFLEKGEAMKIVIEV